MSYSNNNIWASLFDNDIYILANNKGADKRVHPHSLISIFIICLLKSKRIISKLATGEISIF